MLSISPITVEPPSLRLIAKQRALVILDITVEGEADSPTTLGITTSAFPSHLLTRFKEFG